jgi:hypothetical protein
MLPAYTPPPAFVPVAPVVGNYVLVRCGGVTQGTATTAGLIRASVFEVHRPMKISELGAALAIGSASGLFQLAIYANNPATNTPGAVLASIGSISTTTAGRLSADITGADVTLPAGTYWQAVNVDASGASAIFLGPNPAGALGANVLGSPTLALAVAGNLGGANLTYTQAFGTWPDLTGVSPTGFSASTNNSAALIVKVA